MGLLAILLLITCSHSVGAFKPGVRAVVAHAPRSRRVEGPVALSPISLEEIGSNVGPVLSIVIPSGALGAALVSTSESFFLQRGVSMSRMRVAEADKSGMYVERQAPEKTIRDYLAGSGFENTYLVVYGPRGAGKSTTVQHCLLDRPGVVCISVNKNTGPSLARALMTEAQSSLNPVLKAITDSKVQSSNDKDLERVLKAVSEQLGMQPTIVFDVALAAPDGTVNECARFLKHLTQDTLACRGILVLSSSYAVAELPPDRRRQCFVHVASFEEQQAREVLGLRLTSKVESSAVLEQIKGIVGQQTMFAADLDAAGRVIPSCAEGVTGAEQLEAARAWAAELEAEALRDVLNVLKEGIADDMDLRGKPGFHVDRLLRELLESDGPINIATTSYLPLADMFAQKLRVADKGRHALVLDLVADTVEFGTPAHRRAAKAYLRSRPRPDDGFGDDASPTV